MEFLMWDPVQCTRLAEISHSCQAGLPRAGWADAEDEGPAWRGGLTQPVPSSPHRQSPFSSLSSPWTCTKATHFASPPHFFV